MLPSIFMEHRDFHLMGCCIIMQHLAHASTLHISVATAVHSHVCILVCFIHKYITWLYNLWIKGINK